MGNTIDLMGSIHEEQLSRLIHSIALFGFILLILSFSRSIFHQSYSLFCFHLIIYIVVIFFAFLENHLPYRFRIIFLLALIYFPSMAGLLTLGLVGHGAGGLVICCVLATTFFGKKGGLIAILISAATISVIGTLFVNGRISFNVDILDYSKSISAWITCVVGIIILTGVVVTLISTINSQMLKLAQNLSRQNTELLDANKKLENSLSKQRKLKHGLEQAQKMELIGIIAGGVVHDLNNMLAVSISYPELILMELPENSPFRDSLKAIKKSGLRAAAIVQDLLTLSRRRVAVSEVINLNSIVADCVASPEVERIKSYHPGVDIEFNLDRNLWNMDGFPIHLLKTIINIISNAAEAMPGGGKINIETFNLAITEDNQSSRDISTGNYCVLTVSDEGEGISEKNKEKIFEPFFTKKEMGRSGTGLGMTIVWNTVQDHNGHILLESAPGNGTTFTLYFPMTEKPLPLEKEKKAVPHYTGRGESVLVVDDVKEQRDIAESILSRIGYSVITKKSGEEAVDFIKEKPVDLVMLNMIMGPGMDGFNTYKKILESYPCQKAILVSGFSDNDDIKKAQNLGAGAYIKKPYLMETIAYAVRAELDKNTRDNN